MLLNDKKTEIDIKKTDDYNNGQKKVAGHAAHERQKPKLERSVSIWMGLWNP